MPGLPSGYRWKITKDRKGILTVHLQKFRKTILGRCRWKDEASQRVGSWECWGDSFVGPETKDLSKRTKEVAEQILERKLDRLQRNILQEQIVGVYESRKIQALP